MLSLTQLFEDTKLVLVTTCRCFTVTNFHEVDGVINWYLLSLSALCCVPWKNLTWRQTQNKDMDTDLTQFFNLEQLIADELTATKKSLFWTSVLNFNDHWVSKLDEFIFKNSMRVWFTFANNPKRHKCLLLTTFFNQ